MGDNETTEVEAHVSTARNGQVRPPSSSSSSPSAARRQLGIDLRSLRRSAKMTLDDVAEEIERSPATMSRLERGTAVPRLVDVRALLDLYGERTTNVVTEEIRLSMLDLVRDSRRDEWFNDYRDVLGGSLSSAEMQRYVEIESDAREMLSFQAEFVPGLLQTPLYARAVADTFRTELDDAQKQRFVDFRLARQSFLDRKRLHVVISEVALRRQLGSPSTMLGQLEKLAEEIHHGRDTVTVQIVPISLVLPAATMGPFVVMRIDGADSDVVYLESRAGARYLRKPADLAHYTAEFGELTRHALDDEGSLKVIAEVMNGYR